ncbi:MAG TPA: glycosyltransferase N-terminal domain-containing protein [Caulobacteraceae bacterium]|jgi:3-deoxy-D-manno-octulosonic-acid transferase
MSVTPGLVAYRATTALGHPLATPWLRRRLAAGKEDPARWREKLGFPGVRRPPGALAWLHGASVGEALSLVPLAQALHDRADPPCILVTSGTRASAELLTQRLPAGVIHQFAPLDTPQATSRFLRYWRPDLGVFAESELWPNLILGAKRQGARLALVSAKLSAGSLAGWRRASTAARSVLGAFDLVLARDGGAAEGLRSLGARVDGHADLKFGASPLPVDEAALAAARAILGDRPLILAASTHEGEDAAILQAFAPSRGLARLVIAPRHVERGPAIAALARAEGLTAGLRSTDPEAAPEILVADTLGELGLWYRLATLAIIGGGFVEGPGGHNPLEPARLDCPLVSGPHVANWPVFHNLAAAGATRLVNPADLSAVMAQAAAGDATLRSMAQKARSLVEARDAAARAAIPRILALL